MSLFTGVVCGLHKGKMMVSDFYKASRRQAARQTPTALPTLGPKP